MTARADDCFPALRSVPPGSRTIISLRDGLDFTAAPALREQLTDVLRCSKDPIMLDLSQVTSCDAAGLAVLIGTQRRARLLGIAMCLVAPSFPVRKALKVTGLRRNFTIFPDLPAAAVGVTLAAVHAMVLNESGCSRISFSRHSACEF